MVRYVTQKGHPLNWDEAAEVIRLAPLGESRRDPDNLRRAFESSFSVVYAFDSDKLIGLGRALCDGVYQAAIYDVVLLPDYQGQGIGKEIMKRLCDQLPVENIILYSVPGREGFYKKCGFKRMLTAMAVLSPVKASPGGGYLEK